MNSELLKRLNQKPPPNYVAGVGRGATGFTTRSDVGPSAPAETRDRGSSSSAGPSTPSPTTDLSQFDSWGGYSENLFSSSAYDKEDEEADKAYEDVENRLLGRRKRQREEKEAELNAQYRKQRPKIQTVFADLKSGLTTVSEEEWGFIPEVGDRSVKKKKQEIWTPVPDSLLSGQSGAAAGGGGGFAAQLDDKQMAWGGMATPENQTPVTDLRAMGEARSSLLSVKLGQLSDSVSGQTVMDPKGYLTGLSSQHISSDAEVGDIKRARLLLKAVTTSNPKHPPGWIAAARIEEFAGKITIARKIIQEGCEACPESEDVWLESVRLQTPAIASRVLAKAVEQIPHSVKLWLQAANLESDPKRKKNVLRKAVSLVPQSVRLWKELVELEEPEDARILLARAVECVNNVDLWLALARLENYQNAKAVLNQARQKNPQEPMIWITGAQLEEAHNNDEAVERIISLAVTKMSSTQTSRENWLAYAEGSERAGHIKTCQAIVRNSVAMDVDEQERKATWIADAERAVGNSCIHTARSIFAHALNVFCGKRGLWLRAAQLERQHGTPEELEKLLRRAVKYCPTAEVLWLMAAKEKWQQHKIEEAREILHQAGKANPNSEEIWLASVKLESEVKNYDEARALLQRGRQQAGTCRMWMKSAKLERFTGNREKEKELLDQALERFKDASGGATVTSTAGLTVFAKLWLMRLQWAIWEIEQARERDRAEGIKDPKTILQREEKRFNLLRSMYAQACKACYRQVPVWIQAVNIEERICRDIVRARSVLERGRQANVDDAKLLVHTMRLEKRSGDPKTANNTLAVALQKCPNSGLVWAEAIEMEQPAGKRAKSSQAIKKCDRDALVVCAVARMFWTERKLDKARSWFSRATALDKDYGDSWAWSYRFETMLGTEERAAAVLQKCVEADPHHGEFWTAITKDPRYCVVGGCSLPTEEVLKRVAAGLKVEAPANAAK